MADQTVSIPENRRSGGTPYDDAMLELERVAMLAEIINDLCMREELPSASLTHMLRLELDYLEAALRALLVRNAAPLVRQLRPSEVGQFVDLLHRAAKLGYLVLVDSGIRDGDEKCYALEKGGELFLISAPLDEVEEWIARREKGGVA